MSPQRIPFIATAIGVALAILPQAMSQSSRPPAAIPAWQKQLAACNIAWDSQSKNSSESMPLVGHNLGLNVWVENNDFLVLIGSPNCMNENGMQVKLGLVRIKTNPAIFAANFRQELRLLQSEITVAGTSPDGKPATITLWCDANKPVVHASLVSETPVALTASFETWSGHQATHQHGAIQWVKRLPEENPRLLRDMQAQGMAEFAKHIPDPLSKLTVGGRLDAPGMTPAAPATGKFNGLDTRITALTTAAPVSKLDLTVTLRMEQDAMLAAWQAALAADAKRAASAVPADRAAALAWWGKFWDRSHIFINPGQSNLKSGISNLKSHAEQAWEGGRNYQLIRYMLAANTSGRAMTLFNGGNFTCSGNPDSRNWDGCQFMGQNQMLVYWPMLRSGDLDMLKVACDFYQVRTAMRRLHAEKFWNVDGVTFPEPLGIFGLDAIGTNADGRSSPKHLNYHYTSGMVFALMMLAHDSHAGKTTAGYSGTALAMISYYDNYYQNKLRKETGRPLDANDKLVIYPSDACEPYHGCTNNIDVLAGLMALSRDLLDTPPGALDSHQRAYVKEFVKRIPEFKTEEKNGRKFYAAADKAPEWIFHNTNMDFPQMYICFPFSAVSLGRSDMDLVKNTWELGPVNATVQHQNQCWYQNSINFARMGETARAADFTLKKLNHPGLRFPAFYYTTYLDGRSFCHPPDTDHGGVAMTALQEMLMQTDGRRILLGPAWPSDWNAEFKLCAPYQTTVEGRVDGGKVIITKVTPESRRKDITVFPLKNLPKPPLSVGKPATATSSHSAGYSPEKAIDGTTATRWASAVGQTAAWLEVDLGAETAIQRAVIDESSYPQTLKFAIEMLQADGTWKPVVEGGPIGPNRELEFPPATARKFRLHVLDSKLIGPLSGVNINEFQLFEK